MGYQEKPAAPNLPLVPKLKLAVLRIVSRFLRRQDGTVNRRLAWFFDFKSRPNPNAVNGVRTADHTVDPSQNLYVRLFLPAEPHPGPAPAAVFFHGGGFTSFSPVTPEADQFCRRLCKALGFPLLAFNYRLAPEHKYPSQYEDGVGALRFLAQTKTAGFKGEDPLVKEFFQTVDLTCCFLVGDSAGANIAHNVTRRWVESEDSGLHLAGVVLIQPFFGGEERVPSELRVIPYSPIDPEITDWFWRAFLPPGATRNHTAANPRAAAAGLGDGFPPVLVLLSEFDPLLDWQLLYVKSLKENGKKVEIIEYPGTIHVFHVFPQIKQSKELVTDVAAFLRRLWLGGRRHHTVSGTE